MKEYTNWSIDEIKKDLENRLKPNRFIHSLNVMDESLRIANLYNVDKDKCILAGLLHDNAKNLDLVELVNICSNVNITEDSCGYDGWNKNLLHGPAGAIIAQQRYGITDNEILEAIACHVTGKPGMGLVAKVVFLADYTEPGRKGQWFEKIRQALKNGILPGMLAACNLTIMEIIEEGKILQCDTIRTRNDIITQIKYMEERNG